MGSGRPWFRVWPLSSSFLGLPYRILNTSHKKELLRGLWVGFISLQRRRPATKWKQELNSSGNSGDLFVMLFLRAS